MKKITFGLILLFDVFCFAQTDNNEFDRMVEAEMKSASSLQNLRVNPNTQNYDITYHELRFTVNPNNTTPYISGVVKSTFTALSNMNTVTFDMATALVVSSVTMNSSNLTFSQSNYELNINLPATLTTGNSATVEITYAGSPPQAEAGFTRSTHSGTPVIYTLSEPFGARDWWPCKQDLTDKINSFDIYITCPDTYIGVSNGLLQSSTTTGGNTTRHYKHNYPIPAYLISLNVTNYTTYNIQAGLGTVESPFFPINNYLYPENNTSSVQAQIDQTVPIMNVFETKFGPYPYRNEQYGHVQFGWGGGMEHATMSSMGGWSRSLIAHELGHQWFGNKVTCGTWKDIWLNEGLTEYTAGIVVEELDGPASFVSWKDSKINNITSSATGAVYLTDAEALNVNRIFSSRLSYNKGSMVTHMLRWVMGDANFFQALRNYLSDSSLAYGYALTNDLKGHLEALHGSSLSEFFNDWIYMQGYPTYDVSAQNWGAGQAKITINQTQSHASVTFFEMPLEIRLTGAGGLVHDVVVNNTTNNQDFIVSVPFVVTGVQFDPNRHIISRNNVATLANEAFELEQTISIYPNPANDEIHIMMPTNSQLEKVEVYNTLGQLLATHNTTDFRIDNLSSGMHMLKIVTSEGAIHKNFIKK
ncbi:M1 family aminopeptidase [Flavobacterium channae]|uniref:M1 family aminopeptidase n=1 Tax=Flavobacterium channae TaxID=2897181 RepID=UPI001E381143|nr:M1 family aminopeptidase [Flavobacterium channae]UGS23512.1 T9SS type A sorting domain-containing protein [Flavobacterium channae]